MVAAAQYLEGAKWHELLWGLLLAPLGRTVAAMGSTRGVGQSGVSSSGVPCNRLEDAQWLQHVGRCTEHGEGQSFMSSFGISCAPSRMHWGHRGAHRWPGAKLHELLRGLLPPFRMHGGCYGEHRRRGAEWRELLWGLLWRPLGCIVAARGAHKRRGAKGHEVLWGLPWFPRGCEGQSGTSSFGVSLGAL